MIGIMNDGDFICILFGYILMHIYKFCGEKKNTKVHVLPAVRDAKQNREKMACYSSERREDWMAFNDIVVVVIIIIWWLSLSFLA